MTIISARYSNADRSAVAVKTSMGLALIAFDGHDISGGWREVYSVWAQSNETAAYIAPVVRRSVSDHLAAFGFDAIALVNLLDTEAKFAALGVPLPSKCAAARGWINTAQITYASGQTLPNASHHFPEILAEISPLLQP